MNEDIFYSNDDFNLWVAEHLRNFDKLSNPKKLHLLCKIELMCLQYSRIPEIFIETMEMIIVGNYEDEIKAQAIRALFHEPSEAFPMDRHKTRDIINIIRKQLENGTLGKSEYIAKEFLYGNKHPHY